MNQINKIWDEARNISWHTTEIRNCMKEHFENTYIHKLEKQEEGMIFFSTQDLQKFSQKTYKTWTELWSWHNDSKSSSERPRFPDRFAMGFLSNL